MRKKESTSQNPLSTSLRLLRSDKPNEPVRPRASACRPKRRTADDSAASRASGLSNASVAINRGISHAANAAREHCRGARPDYQGVQEADFLRADSSPGQPSWGLILAQDVEKVSRPPRPESSRQGRGEGCWFRQPSATLFNPACK